MSRTDPSTIAVYPDGAHARNDSGYPLSAEVRINARRGCPLVRGPYDFHVGAVNLDCFRFPEDWPEADTADIMGGDTNSGPDADRPARPVTAQASEAAQNRRQSQLQSRDTNTPRQTTTHSALRPLLAYARAAQDPTARNRLAHILMKHSDDICTIELGRITSNQATVNASLDILSTAATTAANIVTGEQASQILTGIGTFTGASRSHLNADVYRNTVAYAISRAITRERDRLREQIQSRQGETVQNFTVDEAIRAVNQYHGVCSFYKGLELVLASVEGDQRTRDRETRRAQIEELEAQIRSYQDQLRLAPDAQKATYNTLINDLLQRIQALTLAGVAVPDPTPTPSPPPDTNPNPDANPNPDQPDEDQDEQQSGGD